MLSIGRSAASLARPSSLWRTGPGTWPAEDSFLAALSGRPGPLFPPWTEGLARRLLWKRAGCPASRRLAMGSASEAFCTVGDLVSAHPGAVEVLARLCIEAA